MVKTGSTSYCSFFPALLLQCRHQRDDRPRCIRRRSMEHEPPRRGRCSASRAALADSRRDFHARRTFLGSKVADSRLAASSTRRAEWKRAPSITPRRSRSSIFKLDPIKVASAYRAGSPTSCSSRADSAISSNHVGGYPVAVQNLPEFLDRSAKLLNVAGPVVKPGR